MLHLQTSTESYWTQDFGVTQSDLDFLYNIFLEEETPIKTPELIERLIQFRIDSELKSIQKRTQKGTVYQPSNAYKTGETLIFPAFEFKQGKVVAERSGQNPDYGNFTVLEVEFEDETRREVASRLATPHKLDTQAVDSFEPQPADPKEIYNKYKRWLTPAVVDALREDKDTLFIAKRWFLKSLLLEVNIAHLHLAEALLDLENGGPLTTQEIADGAGFGGEGNPILRSVSLDYGLSQDDRFDEVGPAGQVLWFLRRMEPQDIRETPLLLRYREVNYNPDAMSDDMLDMEEEIDDELSNFELSDEDELEDEGTIRLIYPHWRSGTLPLTQHSEHLFPIAYRTPRIRMTFIDDKTGESMQGWVVRENKYVYGLGDFYQRHNLPVGAQIIIRSEENSSQVRIGFQDHKPRSEWLWIARATDERLRFEEGQRMIGTQFDDLMTLGIDDPVKIDALRGKYERKELAAIMQELMSELAQFSPQDHVNCKTLYSAVNFLRRCPPGPIFALLRSHPAFTHAGGPFWRLT